MSVICAESTEGTFMKTNVLMKNERIPDGTDSVRDSITDEMLIEKFRAGDGHAFTMLVNRYQVRVTHMASMLVGDDHDGMDIAQDAFVKVYENIGQFRGDAGFYTWLYRIVYNCAMTHIRKRKISSWLPLGSDDDEFDIPSQGPDPEKCAEDSEIKRAVNGALKKLPVRQRTAFTLKQLDGLKFKEIAVVMGITEGAAKASYFHAVKKLQDHLKDYGEAYGLR